MKITRRIFLLVATLVTGITVSVLPISTTAASASIDPRAAETEFFNLLNVTRQANGKLPVVRDSGLDQLSLDWAGKMADVFDITQTVIDATDPGNCSKSGLCHRPNLANFLGPIEPSWTAGGENVGTGGTVSGLNDAFIASHGHFANIIGGYNRLGVGVVVRNDRIWVAFNFMMGPALTPPAPTPTATPTPTAGEATAVVGAPRGLPVIPVGVASHFRAAAPLRLVDTRSNLGGVGPVEEKSVFTISLAGEPTRPSDALGVVLNITAVGPSAAGYLTVYPCGTVPPVASNINFGASDVVPNLVTVAFGSNSTVCVYTSARMHLLADLAGWLTSSPTGAPSSMTTSDPTRLLDSRGGERASLFTLKLASSIPAEATAVGLNITVTDPLNDGFLTAYPCGQAVPTASNLNYHRGQTVPNMAVVAVGVNQSVCFYSEKPTHLIVDSASYFAPVGGLLNAIIPDRVLDTRESVGGWLGKLGPKQTVSFAVRDLPGMPANLSGVLLNVTAVDPTAAGFVTVYPCGAAVPTASNLNFVAGSTVANLVTVRVPADGRICIFSDARVHIIADLQALITPTPAS